MIKRIFYAQSGGPTAVINRSLVSLIDAAHNKNIEILIGCYGIHGLKEKKYVSSHSLSSRDLEKIRNSPGGSFGSCRYFIKDADLPILAQHLKELGCDAIVYQGGNDSQLSLLRMSRYFHSQKMAILSIGLPKTIDNDLAECDLSPGFSSAAFFLAQVFRNLCLDLSSMCRDSTKVYIVEAMGRHSGWLGAAASIAHTPHFPGPQVFIVPELQLNMSALFEKIQFYVRTNGYCAISISEGSSLKNHHFEILKDDFGHVYLEGSGLHLKKLIESQLNYKTRLSIPDYLQRSASFAISNLDKEISDSLGPYCLSLLAAGINEKMITIRRNTQPHQPWHLDTTHLQNVAGQERHIPKNFLDEENFALSAAGLDYFHWALGSQWEDIETRFWPHWSHQ